MSNRGEGSEVQPSEEVQLREWALQISQNHDEDAELQEWVEICQSQKKPTFLAAEEQYLREELRLQERVRALPRKEKRLVRIETKDGFSQVRYWLRGVKDVFEESADTLATLVPRKSAIEKAMEAIEKYQRGEPDDDGPIPLDDFRVRIEGRSFRLSPIPREQQEAAIKKKRFLKVLLMGDPTGFMALDHELRQHRRQIERLTGGINSWKVATNGRILIGEEVGVERFKTIFSGIEQKSWGAPNPHTPQTS